MSYDITSRILNARATADARAQAELEDRERFEFLQKLDAAPFEVTDWEAQFLESFLKSPRTPTPRQREVIDELRKQYAGRLP